MLKRSGPGPWIAATFFLALAAGSPALGQRTQFDPSISLFLTSNDNVQVVEPASDAGASPDGSDRSASLDVWLPVTRATRFGSLSFSYIGGYTRYDQSTVYDNYRHTATIGISPKLGESASLIGELTYALSQEQGIPARIDDEDQFLTVRTDRTFYSGSLRYANDARRWFWDVLARATRSEFAAIEGTLPDTLPPSPEALQLVPEDRTFWFGHVEIRRKFTRRLSLGPRYSFATTQPARSPDEVVHALSLSFEWKISPYFAVDGTAGTARRTTEGDDLAQIPETAENEVVWTLGLTINPPLAAVQKGKLKLGFEGGVFPSGGGALQGTSTNSYVRLYVGSNTARSPWSWDLGTRYTRRESTLDDFPTFETAGIDGYVDYGVGSLLSIRLTAGWSEQLNAESDSTSASIRALSLGVVFYPKGKSRSGIGSSG